METTEQWRYKAWGEHRAVTGCVLFNMKEGARRVRVGNLYYKTAHEVWKQSPSLPNKVKNWQYCEKQGGERKMKEE